MKKAFMLIAAMVMISCTFVCSAPDAAALSCDDYEYTAGGVLTAYYGDEFFIAPAELNGTKIVELGDYLCFDVGLRSVSMNDGIIRIGKSAFEGCNTECANIVATVKKIEDRAFANCDNLSEVYLHPTNVELGKNVFMGTGYIDFFLPCTANLNTAKTKIATAKGDNNFKIELMHENLVESMTEKDIFGENMIYCEDCGKKFSRYLEDINVPFNDVSEDAWYYPYVATAYNLGIINGKSSTVFDPNAGMTCAEAAKIAACIHRLNTYGEDASAFKMTGGKWYETYVNYCYAEGIIEDAVFFNWEKNATRGEMAYLFSRCEWDTDYINDVPLTDIPDVFDSTRFAFEILDLYNKGIAVGSDQYYTFYPNSYVKRSEASALVARILMPQMRIELPKG